jgi:ribosomal protein S21
VYTNDEALELEMIVSAPDIEEAIKEFKRKRTKGRITLITELNYG